MSSETQFWHWFQQHQDELFDFERDQESTFDRLNAALGAVDDDLTFEFGPVREGMREFVISAAGLKRAFPAVERLYNARPSLDRFHVTAFRPRRPLSIILNTAISQSMPATFTTTCAKTTTQGKLAFCCSCRDTRKFKNLFSVKSATCSLTRRSANMTWK